MKKYVIALVVVILLIIIAGAIYLKSNKSVIDLGQSNQIFCTKEAKLCSDGVTYVGRQGPKCEFAECPVGQAVDDTAGWETYKSDEYGFEVKYPNGWYSKDCGSNIVFSPDKNYVPMACNNFTDPLLAPANFRIGISFWGVNSPQDKFLDESEARKSHSLLMEVKSITKIAIAGIPALKVVGITKELRSSELGNHIWQKSGLETGKVNFVDNKTDAQFKDEYHLYNISYTNTENTKIPFDKILSTFKFTK